MPRTDAQKKARNKYIKEHCRRLVIMIYPTEPDMMEKIENQKSYSEYIKRLIREDMAKNPM